MSCHPGGDWNPGWGVDLRYSNFLLPSLKFTARQKKHRLPLPSYLVHAELLFSFRGCLGKNALLLETNTQKIQTKVKIYRVLTPYDRYEWSYNPYRWPFK